MKNYIKKINNIYTPDTLTPHHTTYIKIHIIEEYETWIKNTIQEILHSLERKERKLHHKEKHLLKTLKEKIVF